MKNIKQIFKYFLYFIYISAIRFTPENYRPYSLFFPLFRKFLVSNFTDKCGKGLVVKHNSDISPHIKIGNFSELGTRCMIQSNTTLGNNVIMGPDVKIYTRNHNYSSIKDPVRVQGKIHKTTTIGNDVWIGANVIILPGITVGNKVVIGAGSVITKNIPDLVVVGGNPAKIIKERI